MWGPEVASDARVTSKRNVSPVMGLGDSPCTLLVSPWLGEVVGASLAMG